MLARICAQTLLIIKMALKNTYIYFIDKIVLLIRRIENFMRLTIVFISSLLIANLLYLSRKENKL